jgi:mannose-6-phosphate isomerase-like protein (cupin superfamily)
MRLQQHSGYEQVVEKATWSHRHNRCPHEIGEEDVRRARLYCYAFRRHTIGAFHAARAAIEERPPAGAHSTAHRDRARETLEDLANQAMLPVPRDYRAVIATFWNYHRGVERVLSSLTADHRESGDEQIRRIAERFCELMEEITTGNGVSPTQDTGAPAQATFLVPNLGIIIVPLVYGDHHSWNLAWLTGEVRDAPTHWHHEGVEIHLGYNPTHGVTVLGDFRAEVNEGYAEPIPPGIEHGWINTGGEIHHVPFIYGTLKHGGWGVFFDVDRATRPTEDRTLVDRESEPFRDMVYLERAIAAAEAKPSTWRTTLIPFTATERGGGGGLELSLTRLDARGYTYPTDEFRIVSVVRGAGTASIDGIRCEVAAHDHFGIPAGMNGEVYQCGDEPLVALDATLRSSFFDFAAHCTMRA